MSTRLSVQRKKGGPMDADDIQVTDLEDPAFLSWLDKMEGTEPIEPDECDIDPDARTTTPADCAHEYREAQVRKLIRTVTRSP
jgi:hypothetical protein